MYTNGFVDSLPLWTICVTFILIIFLSIEAGWELGSHFRPQVKADKDRSIGIAVGATMGLLSFLLAFVFGMSASRLDVRKGMVVSEANAIGTTYLRTDFLPDSLKAEARSLLRKYVVIRAGGAAVIMSADGIAKSASSQARLWEIGSEAVKLSDTVSVGLFVNSLNEMIDIDTAHMTAFRNKLPDDIWLMLTVVLIIAMTSMGFEFGLTGTRRWFGTILLILAFTAVIILIADLDRPERGIISVNQQPLLDLLAKIGGPTP